MRIRDRIRYNFGSGAFGFIVYGLGQLLLVPFFLSHWSPELFGEWTVLWSIPAMIWAVEQMLIGAVAARLLHLQAKGESSEADTWFHNLLFLHLCLAVLLFGLALLCCYFLPVAWWLKLKEISAQDARHISALILVYMTLVIFANIVRIPFMLVGKFWLGNLHGSCTQAAILLSQVLLLSHSVSANPLFLVFGIITTHGLCLGVLVWIFRATCRPYTLAWKRPSWSSFCRIITDNLPPLGFNLAQTVLAQSFLISIQLTLGPYYVSAFSTLKTICRTFYQAAQIVLSGTGPELAMAIARKDFFTVKRIKWLLNALLVPAFFTFIFVFFLFQGFFIHWWTHGKIGFHNQEILIFSFGIPFLVLWTRNNYILNAAIQYKAFSYLALGFSLVMSGTIYKFRPLLSFDGFLAAASIVEFCLYLLSQACLFRVKKKLGLTS